MVAMSTKLGCKFGQELELMILGKKPMAIFYRAVKDEFDETGGQPFGKYVASGKIIRSHFFVSNEGQNFKTFYVTFTVPGEEWRARLYKTLKKIGQNGWNRDLEIIEGRLLGYEGYEGRPIA
jgi:hypothetical protein